MGVNANLTQPLPRWVEKLGTGPVAVTPVPTMDMLWSTFLLLTIPSFDCSSQGHPQG